MNRIDMARVCNITDEYRGAVPYAPPTLARHHAIRQATRLFMPGDGSEIYILRFNIDQAFSNLFSHFLTKDIQFRQDIDTLAKKRYIIDRTECFIQFARFDDRCEQERGRQIHRSAIRHPYLVRTRWRRVMKNAATPIAR